MFLRSLSSALPQRAWTQSECWQSLRRSSVMSTLKPRSRLLLEKVLCGNNGIDTRYFATDCLESLFTRPAQALNETFEREATTLAAQALRKALAKADLVEVDAFLADSVYGLIRSQGLRFHFTSFSTTMSALPGVSAENGQSSTQFAKS